MRRAAAAILFLLAAALPAVALPATAAAAAARPAILGTWFTEGTEDGDHFQSVFSVLPDGNFVKQFRDATCHKTKSWRAGGRWRFDGRRMVLDTTLAATGALLHHDVFDYHAGDADHFSMTDEDTKITWKFVRVPDGTRLDDGPCVS
ncbi:MAG TPA: hypothetical protein VMH86_02160 [Rhizomicrobium sp.]|nr:hypothetical protein [Rhizomicrobium sp.]